MSNLALHTISTEHEPSTVLDTGRRAYLTEGEVEQIIRATRNRRDALMVLMGYRHGLRVSELVRLQWRQLDLETGHFRVHRAKHGEDAIHPLSGREIRGLRKIRRGQPVGFRFVFDNGRGAEWILQAAHTGRSLGWHSKHLTTYLAPRLWI